MDSLDAKMDKAWKYALKHLYSPVTHQFYDYLTLAGGKYGLEHLPSPGEIKAHFPNPCGWGTGMEDCVLLAGSVMDILRMRHRDGDKTASRWAEKIIQGIHLSCTVHGTPGFVARGVSPRDGESVYINSSRDQFTLAVYAVWRFLREPWPITDPSRKMAVDILVDIASYCEINVTPDKGDNLLRLDGRPGLVSKMRNVKAHEALRLSMFYRAAHFATNDRHWRKLYDKEAPVAAQQTLCPERNHAWWDIELSQLQYSLALLSDIEGDEKLSGLYARAARMAADISRELLRQLISAAEESGDAADVVNEDFRTLPFMARRDFTERGPITGFYEGLGYFIPQFPDAYQKSTSRLRALGNLTTALMLDKTRVVDDSLRADIYSLLDRLTSDSPRSSSCINAIQGYYLLRRSCSRPFWSSGCG